MVKKIALLCYCLLSLFFIYAQEMEAPRRVIFDTDMGPDYDDVGAIAILHDYAAKGKANILATMASTNYEGVAAVMNVLNTYFNRPNIPIGVAASNARNLKDWQHWTDTLIAKYPHAIKKNGDAGDAVILYRKILAKQPDNSVTIITVGFLTNISNLMQSRPDKYSKLNGTDLLHKKISKLVCMAGKFPAGSEYNIREDAAAARYVFEHFTKTVIFSGVEIGEKVKSGLPLVQDATIKNSPLKDVFRICIPMAKQDSAGRSSWDETAVVIGIAGHEPYYNVKPGFILIAADGSNTWNANKSNHFYVVENKPPKDMERLINDLMLSAEATRHPGKIRMH